jgi:hypothetical protein
MACLPPAAALQALHLHSARGNEGADSKAAKTVEALIKSGAPHEHEALNAGARDSVQVCLECERVL